MTARAGVVEELMNPREKQPSFANKPIPAPLESDDWVDIEPEEAPPTVKNVSNSDLDYLLLIHGHLPFQTPNRHLQEWREKYAESYLPLFFARYAPPPSQSCASCQEVCDAFYKCRTCLVSSPSCGQCLADRHRQSPTHCIERFNDQFWETASLAELGLVLHLGHGGEPCPQKAASRVTVPVLVGDIHGFAHVNVGFCDCPGHETRGSQLLTVGLMPCTDNLPQSAFTLAMLDHLSVFTTAGKCSAFKYWTVLKRLTNTGFPGRVSDRYRELLQTLRKYNYLISRKRCGVTFQPHPLEKDPSDGGIPCVACPRPTYNFNESEISDPDELEYFRFWASFDGNFRNPRKDKKIDPDDVCLTDGNAYFVAQEDYKKFIDDLKTRGVRGGERYAYGDYAVASFIHYITREGPLKIGLTYDIWCQWSKNLLTRAKDLPAGLRFPEWLDLVGGIPKFHLMGHKQSCKDRFSLNWMTFVGRLEGEGCERAWAYLNETAGSTSEMSPGFRHDTINYLMADWNYVKMIGMAVFLATKYKDALKGYEFQRAAFASLDACISATTRRAWLKLKLTAKEGPVGVWTSVYSTPSSNGKLQSLARKNQETESDSAHSLARKTGVTQWIITGVELESEKKRLEEQRRTINALSTLRQKELFDDKCKALNERIILFREKRAKYMGQCEEPDHPDHQSAASTNPEDAELGLPSAYSKATVHSAGLEKLGELEADIRCADCNDTLDRIRDLLGAKAVTLKYKHKNHVKVTRAEAALQTHGENIRKEQWRYNNSRSALIRLGADEGDLNVYQKLQDSDLKYLKDFSEGESIKLGQKEVTIPWIWAGRSDIYKDEDTWLAKTMKVEWFRARARFTRWEEELKLLKREMVMSYRSFKTYQSIWKFKAEMCAMDGASAAGKAQYAYARSNFFRQLAEGVLRSCLSYIKDETVTLRWCSDWVSRDLSDVASSEDVAMED
ncbi:hypothetical protein FRC09_019313 [Ceratobasidium sp. 395]|nr:hypothetical protein FRC09_019313 [Ceratobasidium sp. 395]